MSLVSVAARVVRWRGKRVSVQTVIYADLRQLMGEDHRGVLNERHANYREAEDTYTYKAELWVTFLIRH